MNPSRGLLLITATLWCTVAPGQTTTDIISFTEPARIEHSSIGVNATWLGVIIPPNIAPHGNLVLDGEGAGVVKHLAVFHGEYGWLPIPTVFAPGPQRAAITPAAQVAALSVGDRTGSLWFQAQSLEVSVASGISLLSSSDFPCMTQVAPADADHGWSSQFAGTACIDEPSALLSSTAANDTWVQITASGIFEFGMHNVTVTCEREMCIEGGGFERTAPPPGVPGSIAFDEYTYSHYSGVNASMEMVIPAAWLVVGGSSMDVRFDGTARLAKASPASCHEHCWMDGDGTAALQGRLVLSDLQQAPGGRLQAALSGDVTAAKLDQVPVASFSASDAIAATGGIALILGALKLGAALLTRRSDPLKHPNRRRLYEAVQEHPGATFRELVRRTEIPTGTARHHLQVLARANVISIRPHRETLRHFDNHGQFDTSWRVVTILREPELRLLSEWLAGNPGMHQRGIMEESARWGWSRSTTQHRLRRLEAEGMVTVTPRGRLKCYSVPPQVASAAEALLRNAAGDAGPPVPA